MALHLPLQEPEAGPWHAELLTVVAAVLMQVGQQKRAGHRSVVLAVDGRSSSGMTTLAARLRDAVTGSSVVHTDDIAWQHSRSWQTSGPGITPTSWPAARLRSHSNQLPSSLSYSHQPGAVLRGSLFSHLWKGNQGFRLFGLPEILSSFPERYQPRQRQREPAAC